MKHIKILLLALGLLINITCFASNPAKIPDQEKKILQVVGKILTSSHSLRQSEMWPGYDLTESPVVITFGNGHIYAFNMQSFSPDWQKIQINHQDVLFSPKDNWGLTKMAFNPQFPLEGQMVYVFNLDQAAQNPTKPFQILVHERFHRHEFDHFENIPAIGRYVDHLNIENLALAKLEEMALADFMKAKGDPSVQMHILRDFISINHARRALIHPSSRLWEEHQQVMEGLADYVSFRIMDAFDIVQGFDGCLQLGQNLDQEADNRDYSDHAMKWRHYSIGASLGYVLDFLKAPHWKEKVEKEGETLTQLLEETVDVSPEEMEVRLEQCKVLYGWDDILANVGTSVHQFEKEVAGYIKDYKNMEGVVLEIGRPRAGVSGSGANARMLYLADGTTLSLKDTLATISGDNLWHLNVKDIPYIFKKDHGTLEFKVDPKTEIVVDQQKFQLKDLLGKDLKRRFNRIEILGKACRFSSEKHSGVLIVRDGIVRIVYS